MLNVLIAGVGGQGSVLAAKILAQAALAKGWQVRTAETIGMAQRGGNVTSHVRMGNGGETVEAPLIARGTADVVIALEPGEGVRALPYLAPDGLLVCATSPIPSVMSSLSRQPYDAAALVDYLRAQAPHFAAIDDAGICKAVGSSKVLNVALLTAAVQLSADLDCGLRDAVSIDALKSAMQSCVKERFVQLNGQAIDATIAALQKPAR
jgi:indolepyruvate ferredoxin oxidoreductase beta subunit